MEVYFADVGQGTCNVILLGKRRAIVIDTGRRASDLRRLLNHLNVAELPCLAMSHLDADHIGGAPAILTEFRGRIGTVCYPNDHRIRQTPFWAKHQAELEDEHLTRDQLVRMECENNPKRIWRSAALEAELKLFSPTFGENQAALEAEDANATSGVLVLRVGTRHIVFPGDSRFEQWKEILNRRGAALACDIIAIPHHAGMIWPSHWDDLRIRTELNWLYSKAILPSYAVISVGTSNAEGHPRREVMETLCALGIRVICTQITAQCCKKLEGLRPGLLPLVVPGRSSAAQSLTSSGNSRDVGCASTVVADISPTVVSIRRCAQHQAAVTHLKTTGTGSPICR